MHGLSKTFSFYSVEYHILSYAHDYLNLLARDHEYIKLRRTADEWSPR